MRLGKLRFESKYQAIKYFYEKKQWSVNWMCKQLGISHAAYYKWLHRTIPEQESENTKLAELIKEYDERFGHILGYRRMTSWINHFNHTSYSRNRVHRIMRKLGIHSIIRKKKKKYPSSRPETTAENKLKREFNATKPNEKWATDVTEFKVPETGRKLYLSVILDLYDRFPVAYVISGRNDNKLVFDTYDKALKDNPDARPIFHSDRGFQYTRRIFQKRLREQGMAFIKCQYTDDYLLTCVQLGISIADLDLLTIGLVNDMFTERQNDGYSYKELASQSDFDRF